MSQKKKHRHQDLSSARELKSRVAQGGLAPSGSSSGSDLSPEEKHRIEDILARHANAAGPAPSPKEEVPGEEPDAGMDLPWEESEQTDTEPTDDTETASEEKSFGEEPEAAEEPDEPAEPDVPPTHRSTASRIARARMARMAGVLISESGPKESSGTDVSETDVSGTDSGDGGEGITEPAANGPDSEEYEDLIQSGTGPEAEETEDLSDAGPEEPGPEEIPDAQEGAKPEPDEPQDTAETVEPVNTVEPANTIEPASTTEPFNPAEAEYGEEEETAQESDGSETPVAGDDSPEEESSEFPDGEQEPDSDGEEPDGQDGEELDPEQVWTRENVPVYREEKPGNEETSLLSEDPHAQDEASLQEAFGLDAGQGRSLRKGKRETAFSYPRDPAAKELSDEDILMMNSIGFAADSVHAAGAERVERVLHRARSQNRQPEPESFVFGYPGEEYSGRPEQIEKAHARFDASRKRLRLRVFFTVVLLVLTAFFDSVKLTGLLEWAGESGVSVEPVWNILISMQFMILAALICYRKIWEGIKGLLFCKPIPWSVQSVMLLTTLIYDVLLMIFHDGDELLLYHVPAVAALLWGLVCDFFTLYKERLSFDVATADGVKWVLKPLPHRMRARVYDDGKVPYVRDMDEDSVKLGATRTWRVRNYFARSARYPKHYKVIFYLLLATLLVALSGSMVAYGVQMSADPAAAGIASRTLQIFILLCQFGLPVSLLIGYVFPQWKASRYLAEKGATEIGNCTGETLGRTRWSRQDELLTDSDKKVKLTTSVVFSDRLMYSSMLDLKPRLIGDVSLVDCMNLVSAAAAAVGGTPEYWIDTSYRNNDKVVPGTVTDMAQNGFCCDCDGRHVMVGAGPYLHAKGILVPDTLAQYELKTAENTACVYVAVDGQLSLMLEVTYVSEPTFERIVWDMASMGLQTAIYSYDPNLSDRFLSKARVGKAVPVKVYKPLWFEEEFVSEDEDCDMLARSELGLAEVIKTDRRLERYNRGAIVRGWVSLFIGAGLTVALTLAGQLSLCNGLTIAVYQSAWCLSSIFLHRENFVRPSQRVRVQQKDARRKKARSGGRSPQEEEYVRRHSKKKNGK